MLGRMLDRVLYRALDQMLDCILDWILDSMLDRMLNIKQKTQEHNKLTRESWSYLSKIYNTCGQ